MQQIAQQLQQARAALALVAGANAALEARLLAQHAWNMSPEDLLREGDALRDNGPFLQLVERRKAAEPVAQILGKKAFWKDEFFVSRDVLTPRADSETMIETLLQLRPQQETPLQILDLGTGSGCLLLSALREYTNAKGVGADQSNAALAIAAKNAQHLMLHQRTTLMRSDWCSNVGDAKFDIVLSNPPYIPTADIAALDADVQHYEPHGALDGGADGLDCYRSILQQLPAQLNPGALILFEVGQGQAEQLAALAPKEFSFNQITHDLAGIARVVAFTFTA